ncbi:Hemin-binding periplasmic protein HmuT [BD1-7 clade bacterium]|uniref:Hemin-binding periplasmic protein HmuT n=1 Tax=BD1-7 clade bacterium TaxID=2029982 RepID=A0A5S9N2A2_9GAMM|nr:Hemin-binding periplasmic protein HmuT [BD1-7 clade bacterium]CAA0082933.1 Hemin-binding periplasmic protein HmuT [BD1-7 clade bacterium]
MIRFLVLTLALLSQWSIAAEPSAQRLVVVDGSLTEIVYALGAEDQLVAVDTTSVYPEPATDLPNVGYMRALSVEGVLSLRPQKLIASSDAGPPPVLAQLRQSGLDVTTIKIDASVDGLYSKIDEVAAQVGKTAQADQLKQSIAEQLAPVMQTVAAHQGKEHPSALVFLGMQGNQFMVAGQHTKAQALLDLLEIDNAAPSIHGYKPFSQESVLSADADIIIIASHAGQKPETLASRFAHTRAAKNNKVMVVDSALLLGFGPRLPQALMQVADVAYGKTAK